MKFILLTWIKNCYFRLFKIINHTYLLLIRALALVLDDDRPLKIINAPENMSAAIMRLQNFDNRFLYVVKYLDKNISKILEPNHKRL